jgi:hypothetical protein
MKKLFLPVLIASGALLATVPSAHAAAKQYVVVVAEGAPTQILDLGKGYLRKADDYAELATSFDQIIEGGKTAPAKPIAISDLKGILETAEQNGYKTGFVTTTDVAKVASVFYANLESAFAKSEFIGGGGRVGTGTAGATLKAAGGTYITDADGLAEELKGRVLAVQADSDLAYAIDRQPEDESSLAELASLALDTLGDNDTPFVLVVHDTLIKKALEAKDSPALFEQFREIDSILGDVLSRQEDNEKFGVAAILTGGAITPQFQAGTDVNNSYFVLSGLQKSFSGVGAALKGADVESITEFVDATSGEYRGWKLTEDQKSQISTGKLNAETVARASYEPIIKLNYTTTAGTPSAYAIGINVTNGIAEGLKATVSSPAK